MSYKILSKVLVHRLQPFLADLVGAEQLSFVPRRQITDNVVIVQEVIHSMHHKTGTVGWMAIKVDLEKAYDRLSWEFIKDTLILANLPSSIVALIMDLITSASMQILWNGSRSREFTPSRGIRQGDPFSPYIFVLCMERLAHIINDSLAYGDWKPIQLNSRSPRLSHMFFVDDLVLFAECSVQQIETIVQCLDCFCVSLGEKVSAAKSTIFFSKNVPSQLEDQVSSSCGFSKVASLGMYLGVPILNGRVTKATYRYILEKIRARLSGWAVNKLRMAGRFTLIHSVLSTIPLYAMQTSILPMSLCTEIDRVIQNFLWGSTVEARKIHNVC